jgi:mannose-6-phosphate isomerase-like protein (cupin superfamily)
MGKPGRSVEKHTIIRPGDGDPFSFGMVSGRFKIGGETTEKRFAVAQLPEIPPRTLAAPLHRHNNEDEYTYVLDGTLGIMAGEEVVTVGPGTWVVKPRGEWHTFWNGGDAPCHIIEIVSPGGFESYFREVAESGGSPERLAAINEEYSIDMNFESVPELCERFGLVFPKLGD